ncbi:MAG: Na-translocating system protein MpsC family protein [Bacteroidota bacterium]
MVNGRETLAAGVQFIVENFLLNHVGEKSKDMRTEITDDFVVVFIRDILTPAEEKLLTGEGGIKSFHELRLKLFQQSEHILRDRISGFLQKPIRKIHYIHGTQSEDMNIVIYFEPS